MITTALWVRPPLPRRRKGRAQLTDRVQAMRVRLAIRWSLPVSEVGRWRAEYELAEQNGEEVQAWR